jgi:two-component system cell cycle response regulator
MLFSGLFAVWLIVKPGNGQVFTAGEDVARFLGPVVLLVPCIAGMQGMWRPDAWKAKDRSTLIRQLLPIVLSLSVVGFLGGRVVSAYFDILLQRALPSPSAADVGFLSAYPFLLVGILLLPNGTFSVTSRTRILLDTLLIVVGGAAFSWYFILGPTVLQQSGTTVAKVVSASYPLGDFMLICCLLLLAVMTREAAFRRVPTVLGVALVVLIGADSIREYQMVHDMHASGTLLDLARPMAYMLIALAAMAARYSGEERKEAPDGEQNRWLLPGLNTLPHVWRYLLPYCSVPAVVALMIYAARTPGESRLALGVYVAGALLIELVLLHQFLDYRELISIASRNARLESLAAADPVTGLPNHRTMVTTMDLEIARARRYQHPCSTLFLDLDHFKALNDSYGHPSGDAALREFASVVRSALRAADILARWGGEEFVAMLPETEGDAAIAVAERVRAAVAAHTFWAAGGAHLTCSIGVSSFPQDADSRDALIENADQAMYVAKRLGRNQVRSASDPAVAALGVEIGPAGVREEATLAGTVEALAALVEARDHTTGKHVQEVAALAARLALELGLDTSEAHLAGLAGRLHDIGKVAVPDVVLNKPSSLSEDEWTLVRKHAAVGAAVISRIPKLSVLAPAIRAHHEFWNGQGYPDGLSREAIPLSARILAVADAYEAMTSDRPYRKALSSERAVAELDACAGSQFDPTVVAALRRVLHVTASQSVA